MTIETSISMMQTLIDVDEFQDTATLQVHFYFHAYFRIFNRRSMSNGKITNFANFF